MVISWGGWLLSGGHLFWVGSPSMGTVAPVGTLVVTEPIQSGEVLHAGEIIVFRPSPTHAVVIHRIFRVMGDSRFATKGDINSSPDPWTVSRSDVIGTPLLLVPAIGWIYKLAPWFIGGAVLMLVVAGQVRQRAKRWTTTVGPSLLVGLPVIRYRILVNGEVLATTRSGSSTIAKLVNTGILPEWFRSDGSSVRSSPGESVVIHLLLKGGSRGIPIANTVALPRWGWALVATTCLTPLVASWLCGFPTSSPSHAKRKRKTSYSPVPAGKHETADAGCRSGNQHHRRESGPHAGRIDLARRQLRSAHDLGDHRGRAGTDNPWLEVSNNLPPASGGSTPATTIAIDALGDLVRPL
jgi:signal peptidase I